MTLDPKPSFRKPCAALAIALGCMVAAQSQPSTIVVPYPAGQLSDLIAREVKEALARQGVGGVGVENVAGASGALAVQRMQSAGPMAGGVLLGSPNELILAPLAVAAVKHKAEDFQLVAMVASGPLVLVCRSDLATSTDELVELARRVAARQPLTYGSVGIGSLLHLMGEQLSRAIRASLVHVPYKGGAPLMQDLAGGRLDFAMVPYSLALQGLVDQGRVRLLGTVASRRPAVLAAVPTVNEGRSLQDFAFDIWTGFFVAKGVGPSMRDRLHARLTETLDDPLLRAALQQQGLTVARPMSLESLAALYADETRRYRELAASIGLTPQ